MKVSNNTHTSIACYNKTNLLVKSLDWSWGPLCKHYVVIIWALMQSSCMAGACIWAFAWTFACSRHECVYDGLLHAPILYCLQGLFTWAFYHEFLPEISHTLLQWGFKLDRWCCTINGEFDQGINGCSLVGNGGINEWTNGQRQTPRVPPQGGRRCSYFVGGHQGQGWCCIHIGQ